MEIELKFQIPADRLEGVRRAAQTASAQTTRLQARYLDTADRRLAQAAMALRLRLEGPQWVQTLKGRGDGQLQRLEHEVRLSPALAPADQIPALDVQRHADSPAGQALLKLLGQPAAPLQAMFDTDVQRTHRLLRHGAARIELALDLGEIRCGERSVAVRELELELKTGTIDDLLAVARRWVSQHGLWLDVCTKAERGERLRDGRSAGPVVGAAAPAGRPEHPAGVLRQMVAACLAHILPNASDLAQGGASAEHLHQLRVGLRRLRSALRLFGHLASAQRAADLSRWDAELATLLRALGAARDADALLAWLPAALAKAGGPAGLFPATAGDTLPPTPPLTPPSALAVLRAPATTLLWLDLLGWVHEPTAPTEQAPHCPPLLLQQPLRRLRRRLSQRLRGQAATLPELSPEQSHRLRKHLKRLRYGLDLARPWLDTAPRARELKALARAQDALGQLHDAVAAQAFLQARCAQQPEAWFGLGWLAAQQPLWRAVAQDALQDCRRAWKKAAKTAPAKGSKKSKRRPPKPG